MYMYYNVISIIVLYYLYLRHAIRRAGPVAPLQLGPEAGRTRNNNNSNSNSNSNSNNNK